VLGLDAAMEEGVFINVRKLAALDIALHGGRWILIEFWIGVIGLPLFGALVIGRSLYLGVYLMLLGLNYVPLLVYAIIINRSNSAKEEVNVELSHPAKYYSKYGVQQALLLVPFAIPVLAIRQELARDKVGRS
jgi:hypothetical protein